MKQATEKELLELLRKVWDMAVAAAEAKANEPALRDAELEALIDSL